MEDLNVCTWVWGTAYGREYVERLFAGVHRHLSRPFTPWVFHPSEADYHLTMVPGCFARLRMFDPKFQRKHGLKGRVVCLDLDLIITGELDPLFERPEPFGILQGVNHHKGRFNGSVWWTTVGYRPDVWTDFSLEAAAKVPHAAFPDDQAWLEHKIPDAAAIGPAQGAFAFQKPGWVSGDKLPKEARIVAFPGKRDPSQFTHLDWVKDHWL